MYFAHLISKFDRRLTLTNVSRKIKAKLEKYYYYSRNVKRDYRWLLMFMFARFPIGRQLGTSFYRAKYARKSIFNLSRPDYKAYLESSSNVSSLKKIEPSKETSIFQNLELDVAAKSIHKYGYYLGLKLPTDILNQLLEYAYSADISIDGERQLNFKYKEIKQAAQKYNRQILIGNYLAINSECSAMQKLAQDPKLIAIAAQYLGTQPVLVRSQMGWTFVGSKEAYSQKGEIGSPTILYHYDLDDYRALKFFFYLTDVNSQSGSHRCVAGSHKQRKLSHYVLRGQTDQEIADYYGKENMIEIVGAAGFGFAEDPFCFHRGSPPVTASRLMIQLEFAINDYGMWEL